MKFKSDIQAESKVGIGTATVNYPLDVRAGSANSDIAQFTGANDSRGLKISTFQRLAPDDSVDYDCQYNGDAPFVPFGVQTWSMSGSEKMRLQQDGNLGIGTTSPITKLEVSSGAQTKLRITSTDTSVGVGESIGRVEFKSNDASTGGNNVMGFVDCLATNAGSTYALTFGTGNAAAAAEKMRILPNGNVGIGVAVPQQKLEVDGNIKSNGIITGTNLSLNTAFGDNFINSGTGTTIRFGAPTSYVQNVYVQGTLQTASSIQCGSNASTASAALVGSQRYRTNGNNSYVDVCMQTGASTYAWVNIVQNNW